MAELRFTRNIITCICV